MASVQTPTSDPNKSRPHARGIEGFSVPDSEDVKGWTDLVRPILFFVGAVVVVTAVVAGVMSHNHKKAAQGQNELYLARKTLETETKALAKASVPAGAFEKAAADDEKAKKAAAAANKGAAEKDAKKTPEQEQAEKEMRDDRVIGEAAEKLAYAKLDVDAKFPEGVKKLKAVNEQYKGTRPGFEAALAVGNLYADHGDAAKATPWFEKAADDAPGSFERTLAHAAVGYAHETQGQSQEALASFEKALKSAEGNVKADLLLAVARTQQHLSNVPKAKEAYDQVITQFPGTDSAKTAEQQKAQLE